MGKSVMAGEASAEPLQNKYFFALQDEHKLAIAHPGGSEPQRGYSGIGAESSAGLYRKGILKAQLTEDLRDSRVSGERCPQHKV